VALDSSNNGYNPTPQLQQVLASPDIQGIRQRDDVNNSKSYQLAKQLGALQPEIKSIQGEIAQSDKQRAEADVNSMSTEAYAQHLKNNPSQLTQSPVYNAMASRVNAQNVASTTQQGIMQKIASGEQTFADNPLVDKYDAQGNQNPNWVSGNQKLQAYLQGARNHDLQGQDAYAVAGYDSTWQQFVQKATNENSGVLAAHSLAWAAQTSENRFTNMMSNATPDQIPALIAQFRDETQQPAGTIFNKKAASAAYESQALQWADAGDVAKVKALLNTQLDDGVSVKLSMGTNPLTGEKSGEKILRHAELVFEQNTNRAEVAFHKQNYQNAKENLSSGITEALKTDQAGFIPAQVSMPTESGGVKQTSTDAEKYTEFDKFTQGWKPEDRAVKAMNNNIDDLNAQNIIRAAGNTMGNVTTRGVDENGKEKPAGAANQTYLAGYKQWEIYKNLPNGAAAASRLATTEVNKSFEAVHALQNTLQMSAEDAALTVTNANANPKAMGDYRKQANSLISALEPSWWAKTFGDSMPLKGNVDQVTGDLATTMAYQIAAGGDPKTILKSMETFIPNNYSNVAGSLIPNKNIPNSGLESQVVGGSVALFTRLRDEVAIKVGASQGINPDEITVAPSYDGGSFTFMAGGQYLKLDGRAFVMTSKQVVAWEKKDFPALQGDKAYASDRNALKDQLTGNTMIDNMFSPEGSAFKNKVSVEDQYLYSNSGYRGLVNAGLAKKPLAEQRAWATKQLSQGASWTDNAAPVPTTTPSGGK